LLYFLNAFKEPLAASKSCERFCNELVADLTGLDLEQKPEDGMESSSSVVLSDNRGANKIIGLQKLVLLNFLLYTQEDLVETIAAQRLIFLVKHVIPWLQNADNIIPIRAEVCRALTGLLGQMGDIYGEHWGQTLNALAKSWTATQELDENESGMDRYGNDTVCQAGTNS
jgi:hypothetical protein